MAKQHKNNNWNFNKETQEHNFKSANPNEVKQKMIKQNKANNKEYPQHSKRGVK